MRRPTIEAIARTYNTPAYADPVDAIADYDEYSREWENTQLGSAAISTRMELPRGRIRSWEDGSKPDVVRGIETARKHEWAEQPLDSETFTALNRLVAGVFSGGSISESVFVPSYSAPDEFVEDQLRADLETVGAGCQMVLSNSGKVEEFRPESDASVLGRVLVALGAPLGPKAETVDRLPPYLASAPKAVRREFVRVYVANRGVEMPGKNLVQIMEQRDARYLDAVGSLIESVARVEVARGDRTVRFDKRALTTLELVD